MPLNVFKLWLKKSDYFAVGIPLPAMRLLTLPLAGRLAHDRNTELVVPMPVSSPPRPENATIVAGIGVPKQVIQRFNWVLSI